MDLTPEQASSIPVYICSNCQLKKSKQGESGHKLPAMVPQQRVQTNPRRKTPWSARLQSSDSLRMKISKSSVQTQKKDEGGDLVIHGLQGSETQQEPPSETQQQSSSFQTLTNVDASHQTTVPPALLTVSQTILPAGSTVSSPRASRSRLW